MYKTRKRVVLISINVLTILCFIAACLMLLPQRTGESFSWITLLVAFIVFFATVFWGNRFRSFFLAKLRKDTLETGETVILNIPALTEETTPAKEPVDAITTSAENDSPHKQEEAVQKKTLNVPVIISIVAVLLIAGGVGIKKGMGKREGK